MIATMTARSFARPAGRRDRAARDAVLAWSTLQRIALWPIRAWKARRDFAQLAGLSERELADIGLTRLDLTAADAHALDVDRTLVLAAAAEEKRKARRHG